METSEFQRIPGWFETAIPLKHIKCVRLCESHQHLYVDIPLPRSHDLAKERMSTKILESVTRYLMTALRSIMTERQKSMCLQRRVQIREERIGKVEKTFASIRQMDAKAGLMRWSLIGSSFSEIGIRTKIFIIDYLSINHHPDGSVG